MKSGLLHWHRYRTRVLPDSEISDRGLPQNTMRWDWTIAECRCGDEKEPEKHFWSYPD